MPWVMPSVRLGREDEESVFLLADPLHELVDSIDGAGLGPQGTVAHVELKGIGYLGEGQDTCWEQDCAPLGAGTPSSPHGLPAVGRGAPVQGHKVAVGYPKEVASRLLRSGRTKPWGLPHSGLFSTALSSQQDMAQPLVLEFTSSHCYPCLSLPHTGASSPPKGPYT